MPQQFDRSFITEEIIDFLENYDIYRNPNGVEISYNSNRSVMIAVNWRSTVQNPEFDIETSIYAMPLLDFLSTFKVRAINDLKLIKPHVLKGLYEIGQAEVSCIIVRELDCYCIQYRKIDNVLTAIDDEEAHHIVCVDLKTFEDFKNYSFQHYGLPQD